MKRFIAQLLAVVVLSSVVFSVVGCGGAKVDDNAKPDANSKDAPKDDATKDKTGGG